jgi:hypothetical protein
MRGLGFVALAPPSSTSTAEETRDTSKPSPRDVAAAWCAWTMRQLSSASASGARPWSCAGAVSRRLATG